MTVVLYYYDKTRSGRVYVENINQSIAVYYSRSTYFYDVVGHVLQALDLVGQGVRHFLRAADGMERSESAGERLRAILFDDRTTRGYA